MAKTRRDLIEREIERLHEQGELLERDWRRIPYLGLFLLSAGPAYWIWGPTAAMYAVLCTPCLVGTALYLIGVRRSENRQQITELEGQLRAIDDAAAAA
ncbi:MAG TPA: hypothetical protein RMH99_07790 [Sandaracinaceae bacterium LLY-WYZ-13_1]|nr:hypothetical protein [Sandaracinaceae bacterium LLY-WYZ-13_1]